MDRYRLLPVSALISLFMLTTPVVANPDMSAKRLVQSCTDDSELGNMVCRTYIQGFVDGAISTNPSVIEHVFEEAEALGDFKRRAINTRIGQRMVRFGESYLVDFCLAPRDTDDVVLLSIRESEPLPALPNEPGKDWLYRFMKIHFPCA